MALTQRNRCVRGCKAKARKGFPRVGADCDTAWFGRKATSAEKRGADGIQGTRKEVARRVKALAEG